jgi:phosphoadenosine phosphosulfate reductase
MSLIETDIFGDTEDLVAQSIALIKEHEPPEGYYVCFSGGKDSIVMLDLVRKAGVKHDIHMNLTSVDPPELLKFIRQYYPECQMHRPEMSMFQLIRKKGMPPTRLARYCCRLLKEQSGRDRVKITGIRWEESSRRKLRDAWEKNDNGYDDYILNPIINWASDEIWEYIKSNQLPYPSLYDEGFYRIGCIGCPMADRQRYRQFERWPQFKKAYWNTFAKVIEERKRNGKKEVHESVEMMWAWWMEEMPREDKNQTNMFEGRTP